MPKVWESTCTMKLSSFCGEMNHFAWMCNDSDKGKQLAIGAVHAE